MSGTTTHRWIQDDSYQIKNQIFKDGSFVEAARINISTIIREEKLKVFIFIS